MKLKIVGKNQYIQKLDPKYSIFFFAKNKKNRWTSSQTEQEKNEKIYIVKTKNEREDNTKGMAGIKWIIRNK